MKSISYDLENKIGTTFILLDNLQTGVLGLFTMGKIIILQTIIF